MASKLSYHISDVRRNDLTWDAPARAGVRVIKLFSVNMESEQYVQRFFRECPIEVMVFRPGYRNWGSAEPYDDHNPDSLTPEGAMGSIDFMRRKQGWPGGLVWEGLNEPPCQTEEDFKKLNAWYVRFAELLHARGEKAAAFSFSEGNPTRDKLKHLPLLADAIRACDYIALHEYHRTFGYHREIWNALPVKKPVIITETGYDMGGNSLTDGWLGSQKISADEYLSLLKGYDELLMQDPYVLGATVFQLGDPYAWKSFEIEQIAMPMADHIRAQGGGYPARWTPEPEKPVEPVVELSVDKTEVAAGESVTVTYRAEQVLGAWLNGKGKAPAVGQEVFRLSETTRFVWRAQLRDGSWVERVVTVAVRWKELDREVIRSHAQAILDLL